MELVAAEAPSVSIMPVTVALWQTRAQLSMWFVPITQRMNLREKIIFFVRAPAGRDGRESIRTMRVLDASELLRDPIQGRIPGNLFPVVAASEQRNT